MSMVMSDDLTVISAAEAASVICRFSPEMISDVVESWLNTKNSTIHYSGYNLIDAIESGYKTTLKDIPSYSPEISMVRRDTYLNIINQICAAHNITYIGEQDDLYNAAYLIYDFFIGKYVSNIVDFFCNYIIAEKYTLYEALELESKKESSPYSKKLFKTKNSKLAAIHANLEFVIENICRYDVDLNTYIDLVYLQKKPIAEFLKSVLIDNGDFFRNYVCNNLQSAGPMIYTEIRFALQGYATIETNDII